MSAALSSEALGDFVSTKYGKIPGGAKLLGRLTKSSHRTGESWIRKERRLGLPAALELAISDPEFKALLLQILNGEHQL